MRAALNLIGIEQPGGGTREDVRELPRQVAGVARAGGEALAGKRRHQVGGVAGQQGAAVAPARSHARVERVDDRSLDLGVLAIEPLGDRATECFGLQVRSRVLIGAQHPLPAVAPRGHRQRHRRPSGASDEMRMWDLRQRTVDERVYDDPALRRRPALERDLQLRTHGAASTIASNQPAR